MSRLISIILLALAGCPSFALDRPGTICKIFQFPPNMIPRIDGDPEDWKIVPDDYAIGMDQLVDDTNKDHKPDPKDLDVRVKVGWVKGLNRLYFLYASAGANTSVMTRRGCTNSPWNRESRALSTALRGTCSTPGFGGREDRRQMWPERT